MVRVPHTVFRTEVLYLTLHPQLRYLIGGDSSEHEVGARRILASTYLYVRYVVGIGCEWWKCRSGAYDTFGEMQGFDFRILSTECGLR